MAAIPRRMPSANHEAYHEAVYKAIHEEAFHSEHSALSNHVTIEEETQPEDSSVI